MLNYIFKACADGMTCIDLTSYRRRSISCMHVQLNIVTVGLHAKLQLHLAGTQDDCASI